MLSIRFNLKDVTNPEKETLIFLVVRYNKEKIKLSIGEKIAPKFWDIKTGNVKQSKSNNKGTYLNLRLSQIQNDIITLYTSYISVNKSAPDLTELKDIIYNYVNIDNKEKPQRITDFISFMETKLDNMKNEFNSTTNKYLSKGTIKNRVTALRVLRNYAPVIKFNSINDEFISGYIEYMRKHNKALNTLGSHLKILKTMLRKAQDEGYTVRIPNNLKRMEEETIAIALTEDELLALELLSGLPPYLSNVRDIFILGCNVGLRYGDLSKLSIKDNFNFSDEIITVKTEKTNKEVIIPFLPQLKRILSKYVTNGVQSLPHFISDVKFNKYIKVLMQKLESMQEEVNKRITRQQVENVSTHKYNMVTTHTCRRTFATVCYRKGIRVSVIMGVTGHKTEHEFFKYIRITPNENAVELRKAFEV